MLGSDTNQDENIIVKKIEGPSVDDEYNVVVVDNNYDVEEEPPKSKLKLIFLPLIALLVGGGAFYLTQNKEKVLQSDKIVTSTTAQDMEENREEKKKSSIVLESKVQSNEVEKSTSKEKKNTLVVVHKSEPKGEEKVSTHYIEELAMPTVVEKKKVLMNETKINSQENEVSTKENEIKKLKVENIQEINVKNVKQIVKKPKVYREVLKRPRVKKVIVKKRKPMLVAHYEKIKPRIIRVKKGDSLVVLAKRFYGDEKEYKRIVRANRRIRSAKTSLRLGEKLVIPRKDNKTKRRYIIVEKGNTLAMIAKKFYGDERAVSKIVRANSKIRSSRSLLHVGQKVYVPR